MEQLTGDLYGYCHCGCGQQTTVSRTTDKRNGAIRGRPRKYVTGHNRRSSPVDYLEQDCGYDTPCWVWQMSLTQGYGQKYHEGKQSLAHRIYYEQAKGPIPPGKFLDHLCQNRACVNPEHLEVADNATNCQRGANGKLDWDKVRAIRASSLPHTHLAKRYGVSAPNIAAVRAHRTWKFDPQDKVAMPAYAKVMLGTPL